MTYKDNVEGLLRKGLPPLVGAPLLRNYPLDIEDIEWTYQDKETYMDIENLMTKDIKFFDPIFVDQFYPQDMFDELVEICNSYDLSKIDYSHQMNKWEQGIKIPQKFIDYAVKRTRELVGTNDIMFGYHMYAHHQITSEGRVPVLPLHIDWSPGPYMVDLQIGGNRDWGFVARYNNYVCKPNQAIICQPQFDWHYRPAWGSKDPNEYYQAIFFHLINKEHWSVPQSALLNPEKRSYWDSKYKLNNRFRETKEFSDFQMQRTKIFNELYLSSLYRSDAPEIPWDQVPTSEDSNVHERKGVLPANVKEKN